MNETAMRDKLTTIINKSFEKQYEERGLLTAPHTVDDLMANGVILPPMRLGQICYEPCSWQDKAAECRVSSITQKADGTFKIRLTNLQGKWVFEITAEDIGKTVFLTKEEAEKCLKEKENDNI